MHGAVEFAINRQVRTSRVFAFVSHRAVSTAEIADIVTGPRRQHASLIKVLPNVFASPRVASNQDGNDVIRKVAGDRQLPPIQSGILPIHKRRLLL
jgi:hypothetical protein